MEDDAWPLPAQASIMESVCMPMRHAQLPAMASNQVACHRSHMLHAAKATCQPEAGP